MNNKIYKVKVIENKKNKAISFNLIIKSKI